MLSAPTVVSGSTRTSSPIFAHVNTILPPTRTVPDPICGADHGPLSDPRADLLKVVQESSNRYVDCPGNIENDAAMHTSTHNDERSASWSLSSFHGQEVAIAAVSAGSSV